MEKKKRKLTGRALQAQRNKERREQLRLSQFSDAYRAKMDAAKSGSTDTGVTEAPKEASFDDQMSALFPDANDRISSETFNQPYLPDLQAMSQYTDTGEEEPINYADPENRAKLSIYGADQTGLTTTAGTEGAGIASTGAPIQNSEVAYKATTTLKKEAEKIRNNPTAIQKRLMGDDMTTGFTPERLAQLVIDQQEYRKNQRNKPTLLKRLRGK
tara:strand:- start:877 stop:1518 length:642 start_codon:yes stop_codon:yes gene_type:complete